MSSKKEMFDVSKMDAILERVKEDETGQSAAIMNDLIIISRKAGAAGFTLEELAHIATLGHFISRDPDLQNFMNFLLKATQPNEKEELVN